MHDLIKYFRANPQVFVLLVICVVLGLGTFIVVLIAVITSGSTKTTGEPSGVITLLGAPCRLETGPGRARLIPGCDEAPARLVACGRDAIEPVTVARIVKRHARPVFEARAAFHCAALGETLPPIGLMDARTRWGSCTPASDRRPASIRLSWRLALAPLTVADYVVAHECAHLVEANHGPRFWALVRRLVGDPRPHRAWLRANGPSLHAFGR